MVRHPLEAGTRLSNAQWRRLTGFIVLPRVVRSEFEDIAAWYRKGAAPRYSRRRQFAKMRNMALLLSQYVDGLSEEEIIDLIAAAGPEATDRTARDKFSKDLKQWSGYVDTVLGHSKRKPGRDARGRKFIRAAAAIIQQRTGVVTARSTKSPHALKPFLELLCQMLRLDISRGTIDEALKERIRERKQRRGEIPN